MVRVVSIKSLVLCYFEMDHIIEGLSKFHRFIIYELWDLELGVVTGGLELGD